MSAMVADLRFIPSIVAQLHNLLDQRSFNVSPFLDRLDSSLDFLRAKSVNRGFRIDRNTAEE